MAGNWKLTTKNFFIICAKNALSAVIANAALMALLKGQFTNVTSSQGWWNILKVTVSVVGGKEVAIWLPVIWKWSNTNAQPTDLDAKLQVAQDATKQAADAVAGAKDAAAVIEKPKG
jgi:hypothetical protein